MEDKKIRAGLLKVGDIISYKDMANPYKEWKIIQIKNDQYFGKVAVIKDKSGNIQECYSPVSFNKKGYAGWNFVRKGKEHREHERSESKEYEKHEHHSILGKDFNPFREAGLQ